ncbi:HAD family hydrolase [Persicirhabdus sediminis]|uniref:phosphoglycolate phosphatase n=1 Tax=Persicirhabdus sediminis TaxID=454144 RepID=A0A8J7MGM8_9BACT|nr:HAD family hydrolase [Persicirhabdus sediminis]MBK1792542.1 HAD family hydrolase [Persicirhabdus sediminis]
MYKNWIFDWSGTLVDDLALVIDATNYVFRHFGVEEMDRETFRRQFQLPYTGFYEKYLPGVDLDELEPVFREGFAKSNTEAPLLPHALEFLQFAHGKGFRMFILSSIGEDAFHLNASQLGVRPFFEHIYAGIVDKRDCISQLLDTHQLEKSDTVFVGDMHHDVETAKFGGISSIALLTGYNHAVPLAEAEPDMILRDLGLLQKLISS